MVLNMEKELMCMQIKIVIQDGGCLAKKKDREPILTAKLVLNWWENGIKINSAKVDGSSPILLSTKDNLQTINLVVMVYGIFQMVIPYQDVTNKQLFQMKIQMIKN